MDDAQVLRFRRRERDGSVRTDEGDRSEPVFETDVGDGWHDDEGGSRLGHLTQVVLIGDRVVDIVQRPVSGSGYECAALELADQERRRAPTPAPSPELAPHERQLAWLVRIVGGEDALTGLDAEPLQPAPLDVDAVPARLRERVRGIAARLDAWVPALLGDEALASARLVLTRGVSAEPWLLTRSRRDDIAAGAVLYAVAKGNDLVGPGRPLRVSAFQSVCGLRRTPSDRGRSFADAVGVGSGTSGWQGWGWYPHQPNVFPLGSPDLLLSRFRRDLVRARDRALELRRG